MQLPRTSTRRVGLAAGLAGGILGLAVVTGLGPVPALSSPSSGGGDDGPTTTSTTATTSTTVGTLPAGPAVASGTRVVDAAGAGTVTVAEAGGQLSLVSATPAEGWSVEVEQSAGREIEVDFRMGAQRAQVNVELEDGAVRDRVRFRDEASGTDVRFENGAIVRFETDDPAGGGHGAGSGGGSGRGGADDPPGDDHG